MARFILKWRYYKPGAKSKSHRENDLKYIATREGVEKCDESWKLESPTREQERAITKLTASFPSSLQSQAYQDYCQTPNRYTASQLIDKICSDNKEAISEMENYVQYIGLRPRVEKQGTHGLFSQEDEPINIYDVAREVSEHQGIVWRPILSLTREDAERLGYDNANAWRTLLRSQASNLADSMGIAIEDLRWYAAFHNESHHPHVHLICYSVGKEPYLTEEGLEKMKANYAHEIFKNDLYTIYTEQTKVRDELRSTGAEKLAEIVSKINDGIYENPIVETMLMKLSEELGKHKGKMVYGYLSAQVKNLVDAIVVELSADERIKELYELWYEKRDEIFDIYTDKKAPRVPLSQNEEFKTIRNAVVKEVLNIMQNRDILQEPTFDETPDEEPDDEEVEADETERPKNKWELYKSAKAHLDSESDDYDPQKALQLLIQSAKLGCSVAKYQLGKLFLSEEPFPKDVDYAIRWLEEAADEDNQYAEYLLGKLYLNSEDIEQDVDEAERLLNRSAEQGNKYAAYTLAKEYLSGENLQEDIPRAMELLKFSADKGFSQAEYLYGKLLYQGELTEKNAQKAHEYLERAANKGNHYAAYLAGKILMSEESLKDVQRAVHFFEMAANQGNPYAEFQLGKMYLFGNDIPKDFDKAMEYLKSSAEHGNEFAEKLYNNAYSNRQWSASMGVFRLFHHLARIIQDRIEDGRKGKMGAIDRKLRRQIDEKKQAQGLKLE